MCSIVGSYSKEKFIEMMSKNEYRGSHSCSIALIDIDNLKLIELHRSFEKFNQLKFYFDKQYKNIYYIGHVQSPTLGVENKDITRIHPANNLDKYLWHNGLLKNKFIEDTNKVYHLDISSTWDTLVFLQLINKSDNLNNLLSQIDGQFSCILFKNKEYIKVFRNKSNTIWIDGDLNISSIKIDSSFYQIKPNIIYNLDLYKKELIEGEKFENKNDIYYIK